MTSHSDLATENLVSVANTIRAAMVDCLDFKEGRYYATEAGCKRLCGILSMHGIEATVSVGADGRFEIHTPQQPAKHVCHWPGCAKAVPPAMWGCKPHWFRLPKRLRDRIWETYRAGQEISKTPSAAYITVAQEAQRWIAENAT